MATLYITELTCIRKQDVTGEDEIQIWLDGNLRWKNTFVKNQSRDIPGLYQEFKDDTIVVELKEENPNNLKSLGTWKVDATNPGSGPIVFKTSGAHYSCEYHVT